MVSRSCCRESLCRSECLYTKPLQIRCQQSFDSQGFTHWHIFLSKFFPPFCLWVSVHRLLRLPSRPELSKSRRPLAPPPMPYPTYHAVLPSSQSCPWALNSAPLPVVGHFPGHCLACHLKHQTGSLQDVSHLLLTLCISILHLKANCWPREALLHHLLPSSSSSEGYGPLSNPLHPPAFLRFIQTQFSLQTTMSLHGSVSPLSARLALACSEHRQALIFPGHLLCLTSRCSILSLSLWWQTPVLPSCTPSLGHAT